MSYGLTSLKLYKYAHTYTHTHRERILLTFYVFNYQKFAQNLNCIYLGDVETFIDNIGRYVIKNYHVRPTPYKSS